MRYGQLIKRSVVLGVILLIVASCARSTKGDFCLIYEPFYTSDFDTEETREQADAMNAAYDELCL